MTRNCRLGYMTPMQAVTAILTSHDNRVVVMQDLNGVPVLPRIQIADTQGPLKELRRAIQEDIGFEISGWSEVLVLSEGKHKMHCYQAHVSGGRPKSFPSSAYKSMSYLAPELAVQILSGEATQVFLRQRFSYLYSV